MSRRRLLLADDSVTIQKVVNLTFADEGIEVFAVSDGNEAVDRLLEISPDLIMADVNMPGISGYQVCERIRQTEKFKRTPVILLVGSFEPFDEEEARRVGASDYLTKPFQSIRQLVNKVSDLLREADDSADGEEKTSAAASGAGFVSAGSAISAPADDSFQDTQEMPDSHAVAAELYSAHTQSGETATASQTYDDAGMDDEMIETSRTDFGSEPSTVSGGFAFDEAQKFVSRGDYAASPEAAAAADEDHAKTQPLSVSDWREINVPHEENQFSETSDQETAEIKNYAGEDYQPAAVAEETYANETETAQPADSHGVPAAFSPSSPERESVTATPFSPYDDDDEDLLEIPFFEDEEVEESEAVNFADEKLQAAPATQTEIAAATAGNHSLASDDYEPGRAPTMPNEFVSASAAASPAPAGQLSPEMIDAIAQRVIEKLSAETVKEIAWEVVPQHADLIIKKMVEEKLKE